MPANIKNKGKKYGKSGMVAYKHGGRTVPGMFKAQKGWGGKLIGSLGSSGSLSEDKTFRPIKPGSQMGWNLTQPPVAGVERSALGKAGTWIGNLFRSSDKDKSVKWKTVPRMGTWTPNFKKGGSTGPNGML